MKIRKSLMLAGMLGAGFVTAPSSAQVYVCMYCPAGTYSDGNKSACVQCPAGSYCPTGAVAPTQCPAGNYCPAGAGGPTGCPAGNYCPASAGGPTGCPGLKWAPAGSGSCQNCGTNVASCDPKNGNTITCNSGYVKSGNSCIVPSCGAGTYWNGSTCSPCSAGNYCSGGNYGVQTPCPAGQYQNAAGQSGCNSCWFDTYSTGGQANCTQCPSGSYSEQGWNRCSNSWKMIKVTTRVGLNDGIFSIGKYKVTMQGGTGGTGGGIDCMVDAAGRKWGASGGYGEVKSQTFNITSNNASYIANVGGMGANGSAGSCQGSFSHAGSNGGATSLIVSSLSININARGGGGGLACSPWGGGFYCDGSSYDSGSTGYGIVYIYQLQLQP